MQEMSHEMQECRAGCPRRVCILARHPGNSDTPPQHDLVPLQVFFAMKTWGTVRFPTMTRGDVSIK